jgi:hypothetical protein
MGSLTAAEELSVMPLLDEPGTAARHGDKRGA